MELSQALRLCPLIAILRGVKPSEVVSIGQILLNTGFSIVEIPLNSPEDPLASIAELTAVFKQKLLIGAGTVTSKEQVAQVARQGGRLIISPHTDVAIIQATKEAGLYSIPGFSTPTEAFTAIQAGADALKFFPATNPLVLKALKAILPPKISIFPVGGVSPDTMKAFWQAGAAGFGLGSVLYQPGDSPEAVMIKAKIFYDAIRELS